jgi:uncharacterized protein
MMTMKRAGMVLMLMLVALTATAFPTHDGLVTDKANILTPAQKQSIESRLLAYTDQSTNEVAVLIVPSLDGMSVEEYANKVFHEWGIGKKGKDNGVLFLWATGERKVRIEVGYGLEPSLPDGRAGLIIRDDILPHFKRSEWYAGVDAGVVAIIVQLNADAAPVQPVSQPTPNDTWVIILFIGLVIAVALVIWWVYEDRRRIREDRERHRRYATVEPEPLYHEPVFRRSYDAEYIPHDPVIMPIPIPVPTPEPVRRSSRSDDDDSSSRRSSYSSDSSSSWSSSDSSSSSSSFDFGGGDSGGGGASGSY